MNHIKLFKINFFNSKINIFKPYIKNTFNKPFNQFNLKQLSLAFFLSYGTYVYSQKFTDIHQDYVKQFIFPFKNNVHCFFSQNVYQNLIKQQEKYTIYIYNQQDIIIGTGIIIEQGKFIIFSNILQQNNNNKSNELYFKFANEIQNEHKNYFSVHFTLDSENLSFCHFKDTRPQDQSKLKIEDLFNTNPQIGQHTFLISKTDDEQNILQEGIILENNYRSKNFSPTSFPILANINLKNNVNAFTQGQQCTSVFGGSLVDSNGKILGMIMPQNKYSNQVMAIPVSYLQGIIQQYKQKQNVQRPYLGLSVKSAQGNTGAFVVKINSDSPAEKADLRLGDVIEEINGVQIKNNEDLLKCIGYNLNQNFTLTIKSNNQKKQVKLTTSQ